MEELILYIVCLLVDRPEAVQVREVRSRQGTVYRLIVHPRDRGKVIGKDGRTIEAVRAILEAAAARRGLHVTLDVV